MIFHWCLALKAWKAYRTWKFFYAKTTNFRPEAMLSKRITPVYIKEQFGKTAPIGWQIDPLVMPPSKLNLPPRCRG